MCFGCPKDSSHPDGYFEYPQHMFWLKNICYLGPSIYANVSNFDVSSIARCLEFGLSFNLYPYFVYGSSECSGEYAHMHIHAKPFTAH